MAAPSRLIEKLKVGKRFVLMELVVWPDTDPQQHWDSAGPSNKFLPAEVWAALYKKLDYLCHRHFGEGMRKDKHPLDREFEFRLEKQPNYFVKYQFRDINVRNNLNIIFTEMDRKLYSDCLYVQIRNDARQMFGDLKNLQKNVEQLQKENEKLVALSVNSQEYTPSPLPKTNSSESLGVPGGSRNHSEYVPLALNGISPVNHGRYKASKIEDTIKPEPDPYTPSSSQDTNDANQISYIPGGSPAVGISTPTKQENLDIVITVSSSGESRIGAKRRRCRNLEIFGHSDEEDQQPSSSTKNGNHSVENIFSEDSLSIKSTPETIESSTEDTDSGNAKIDYDLSMSPENLAPPKRKRRDAAPSGLKRNSKKVSNAPREKSLDGWISRSSKKGTSSSNDGSSKSTDNKDAESSSKEKQTKDKKSTNEKKSKKIPEPKLVVDREKLAEDNENMRKTMKGLDKLDEMLPADKTLQPVDVLDCFKMSFGEIEATFDTYRADLLAIFVQHKDGTERQWAKSDNLCYFTEVTSVFTDDQKYAMVQYADKELNTPDNYGKYTEFLTSILIMEWGLRIFMALHGFADRREALGRIKLQEEANPMEITQSGVLPLTSGANSKKKH